MSSDGSGDVEAGGGRRGGVSFPEGFSWGVATAAYQIEGGWDADGRGPPIWDDFSQGTLAENGNVGCDHYRRSTKDAALLGELGVQHYRFSISWSRILPTGRRRDGVNEPGVAFYNGLIDDLLARGIRPMVTLYHWDLPSALEEEFGGFLSDEIVECFAEYARLCFSRFGDRVKDWITFNEPWCVCVLGYCNGEHAPGRRDDPGREPYIAGHNLLLAHAAASAVYRDEFKPRQGGLLGITLNSDWWEPATDSEADRRSAERALAFYLGWFAEPVFSTRGGYPEAMRRTCGERLPRFTDAQKVAVRGSSDFFGLNTYSTHLAGSQTPANCCRSMGNVVKMLGWRDCMKTVCRAGTSTHNYFKDCGVMDVSDSSWARTDMGWSVVPWGIRKLLLYIQRQYAPEGGIIITENGLAVAEPTLESAMDDPPQIGGRINFFDSHLREVALAIEQGASCRAYTAWSLLDNFEWSFGYSKRFGLVRVDYDTQKRTPKPVFHWFAEVCKNNSLAVAASEGRRVGDDEEEEGADDEEKRTFI